MVLQAVPVGPSSYANLAETDRRLIEKITGGRYGVYSGFVPTPGAGMQMSVSAGEAFIRGRNVTGQGMYFASDVGVNTVTWPVASGSNPRIDALVLAVGDTQYGALGSGLTALGPKFIVVSATPAASPVAPTDSAIQTAVGGGGWERVADVLIPTSAVSILVGNITTKWGVAVPNNKTYDYLTATVNVQSGSAGPKALTGLSRALVIEATTEAVLVTFELDWSGAAGSTIATLQPTVDGSGSGTGFVFNVPSGRYTFSKTWRITGLSVGPHTFGGQIAWSAGSSLDIVAGPSTSCMILEHRTS